MELGILNKPSRFWNADVTGFCTAIASRKVLARRGAREVHETAGGSGRDYITVLGAGAADSVRLPPYILYKGVNLYTRWTEVDQLEPCMVAGWREIIFSSGLLLHSSQKRSTCLTVVQSYSSWMVTIHTVSLFSSYSKREEYLSVLPASAHHPSPATTGCRSI